MTLDEIIGKRRSHRSYRQTPVPREMLTAVLDAGRRAPSARNRQNWRFVAVAGEALVKQMPGACGGQDFVGTAPVVLVVYATEDRMMGCGQSAATVDCSIALSFMMLKATELGLGTCWLGGFEADKVKKVLALPSTATVVAVSPLGFPADEPDARPRKTLDEVSEFRD